MDKNAGNPRIFLFYPCRMLPTSYLRAPLVALLLAAAPAAFAQTPGVGIGTTSPAASAALEVSSTTKGLLPPRLSQSQRDLIGSPAAGLTIYNTTTNKPNVWNGTAWTEPLTTTEQPYQGAASTTFTYTGSPQTYTVPAGVFGVVVDACGAQGGGSTASTGGGRGARVQATLAVTPGQVLTLDRKSTRLNSSHVLRSRMPSSA